MFTFLKTINNICLSNCRVKLFKAKTTNFSLSTTDKQESKRDTPFGLLNYVAIGHRAGPETTWYWDWDWVLGLGRLGLDWMGWDGIGSDTDRRRVHLLGRGPRGSLENIFICCSSAPQPLLRDPPVPSIFQAEQLFQNLLRPFHSSLRDSDLNFSINIKSNTNNNNNTNKSSREWAMLIWWKFVCVRLW